METLRPRDNLRRIDTARPGSAGSNRGRYHALTAPATTTVAATDTAWLPRAERHSNLAPRVFKLLVAVADTIMLIAAMAVALRLSALSGDVASPESLTVTKQVALLSIPVWLLTLVRSHAYQARHIASRSQEYRRLVLAGLVGSAAMVVLSDLWRRADIERDFVLFAFVAGVALLAVEREIARQAFLHLRRSGYRLRNVAIIGDNAEGAALRRMFDSSPELGYRFAGFVTVESGRRHARPGEVLGGIEDADVVLLRNNVTTAMIAASAVDVGHTSTLVRKLLNAGINVELSPVLPDVAVERLSIRRLGRFPVMFLQPFHQAGWRSWAKRCFDFAVAAAGLIVLSLPLLIVCVLVRLDSEGPIFFRQTRVGRDGKLFDVIKFRTMVRNAHELRHELAAQNEADGPLFKIKHDPRITRVGRVLRKTSIDELPQLWNVLRGEMSLVGPRPALPEEATLWSEELRDRLRVQPGITGMWQVSGRSNTSFDEYSRLDLYYVDNWSLLTDLLILGKTVPTVLLQRGAS